MEWIWNEEEIKYINQKVGYIVAADGIYRNNLISQSKS
jgi:hypothetical protein